MWRSMIRKLASVGVELGLTVAAPTCISAQADTLDGERIAMIDAYALAAPALAETAPTALVHRLSQPTSVPTLRKILDPGGQTFRRSACCQSDQFRMHALRIAPNFHRQLRALKP